MSLYSLSLAPRDFFLTLLMFDPIPRIRLTHKKVQTIINIKNTHGHTNYLLILHIISLTLMTLNWITLQTDHQDFVEGC